MEYYEITTLISLMSACLAASIPKMLAISLISFEKVLFASTPSVMSTSLRFVPSVSSCNSCGVSLFLSYLTNLMILSVSGCISCVISTVLL